MQIPYETIGYLANAVSLVLKKLAAASCEKNILQLEGNYCPLEVEDYNHRERKY